MHKLTISGLAKVLIASAPAAPTISLAGQTRHGELAL